MNEEKIDTSEYDNAMALPKENVIVGNNLYIPVANAKSSIKNLTNSFISALEEDFKQHGKKAIETVRQEDPSTYMRIIAGLMPKRFEQIPSEKPNVSDLLQIKSVLEPMVRRRSVIDVTPVERERD